MQQRTRQSLSLDNHALRLRAQRRRPRRLRPMRVPNSLVVCTLLSIIVFSGCGASTVGGAQNTSGSDGNYLTHTNQKIDASVAGLQIYSDGFDCGGELALATPRLSYDAAEIQNMRDFYTNAQSGHAVPLPSTLQVVNTGTVQTSNAQGIFGNGTGCLADLQITNTGNSTVEIIRAGVKLLTSPVQNTYQYHFVNACSVEGKPPDECNTGTGSPHCGAYVAELKLDAKPTGALLDTPLTPVEEPGGYFCPAERPLAHGDSIEVLLNPFPASSSVNFAYNVVPVLTLRTDRGQQQVQITKTQSWLVFAYPSQYTCYKLDGYTFSVLGRGDILC